MPAAADAGCRPRRRQVPCPPGGPGCTPGVDPFRVASNPAWSPISRPALPRASSAMSGFFFCGMIDDPVENASARVMNENSLVAQRMISSAMRDRSTASIAATKENSATTSRAAVASIEFSAAAEKPSSAATASGSSPSDVPANAPDPYGLIAARTSQSRRRSTSLDSAQQWASRWCDSRTGWACCRCVRPGIATPRCACACPDSALMTSVTSAPSRRASARRYIRMSVAIWSLRERPARRRPPRSVPTRSSSPRSRAVWTSSSAGTAVKLPSATSASRRVSPASIAASSSSVSSPAPCRTRAWAIDPAMS